MKIDRKQVSKARAICPKCNKKGVGYARHPHAFGYKDYSRLSCRYCKAIFTMKTGRE